MRRLSLLAILVAVAPTDLTAAGSGASPGTTGTIERLEVTALTRTHAAFWARADLAEAALGSKQTFTGEATVANVPIPFAAPATVFVQPKGARHEAVFFLDLDLDRTPVSLAERIGTHALDLTLKGTLSGEKGSRARVCAVGVLRYGTKDISAPASNLPLFARFGGASLKGLSLAETSGAGTIVLYNPFGFDLSVKEVTYTLTASGRKLFTGARKGIRIHAGRENPVELPVTAKNADLLAAAGRALRSGGTLEGRLAGSVTVKAGRDAITIPFDLPGRIEVTR